jgi:hypothetical protein
VRHSLDLIGEARQRGWRVLLDAASYLPTSDIDLREVKPDFLTLSLYKIAGYPTGLGALIARKDALAELRRPWFSGGTVKWASVQHQRHRLSDAPEGFEDGTPSFLAAAAVEPALAAVRSADRDRLARHLRHLTRVCSWPVGAVTQSAPMSGCGLVECNAARSPLTVRCWRSRYSYWTWKPRRDEASRCGGCSTIGVRRGRVRMLASGRASLVEQAPCAICRLSQRCTVEHSRVDGLGTIRAKHRFLSSARYVEVRVAA